MPKAEHDLGDHGLDLAPVLQQRSAVLRCELDAKVSVFERPNLTAGGSVDVGPNHSASNIGDRAVCRVTAEILLVNDQLHRIRSFGRWGQLVDLKTELPLRLRAVSKQRGRVISAFEDRLLVTMQKAVPGVVLAGGHPCIDPPVLPRRRQPLLLPPLARIQRGAIREAHVEAEAADLRFEGPHGR